MGRISDDIFKNCGENRNIGIKILSGLGDFMFTSSLEFFSLLKNMPCKDGTYIVDLDNLVIKDKFLEAEKRYRERISKDYNKTAKSISSGGMSFSTGLLKDTIKQLKDAIKWRILYEKH